MLIKIIISLLIILIFFGKSFATKESKVPFLVKKAITNANYDLNRIRWKKHKGDIYEAFDTKDDHYFSLFISRKGDFLIREEKMPYDSLPDKVKNNLVGHDIKVIYKITDYELHTVTYDIHSIKDKNIHKGYHYEDGLQETYQISKKSTLIPFILIPIFILLMSQSL